MTVAETIERHPLAEEVEKFLHDFCQYKHALDREVYTGFTYHLLSGRQPRKGAILRTQNWMLGVRAAEEEAMRKACASVRAIGGYITMTPAGEIDTAPADVPHPRLRRMIAEGFLVPGDDALIDGVSSQSYRLSSIAP
jgi:hypothetical protein